MPGVKGCAARPVCSKSITWRGEKGTVAASSEQLSPDPGPEPPQGSPWDSRCTHPTHPLAQQQHALQSPCQLSTRQAPLPAQGQPSCPSLPRAGPGTNPSEAAEGRGISRAVDSTCPRPLLLPSG